MTKKRRGVMEIANYFGSCDITMVLVPPTSSKICKMIIQKIEAWKRFHGLAILLVTFLGCLLVTLSIVVGDLQRSGMKVGHGLNHLGCVFEFVMDWLAWVGRNRAGEFRETI